MNKYIHPKVNKHGHQQIFCLYQEDYKEKYAISRLVSFFIWLGKYSIIHC